MDKHTARQLDQQWQDAATRREKLGLAKLSQQLISVFELGKMWLSLKEGECLVLSADGSIHKGLRVNARLDKMQKLQEAFRTEEKSDILRVASDMQSAEEMYPIAFNGARAAKWDTRTRLAPGESNTKGAKKRGKPAEKPGFAEVF